MKKTKKIFLACTAVLFGISLTACKEEETTRNSTTPYGDLNLSSIVATASNPYASNESFKLSLKDYYNRLRSKSYSNFLSLVNNYIYAKEFNALKALLNSTSYDVLTAEEKKALSYTDEVITSERYDYLVKKYKKSLSSTFESNVYGTSSAKKYKLLTAEEKESSFKKYADSLALKGYVITTSNFQPTTFDTLSDTFALDLTKIPQKLLDLQIQDLAAKLYSEKKVYTIADKEYLNEGTSEEKKNSYYLFTDSMLKSTYADSYYKYGEYNAIIIQFNTLREATENIADVMSTMGISEITEANAAEFYVKLYDKYYSYRSETATSIDDEEFIFNYTPDYNELSNVSTGISTLVTSTLENGEFLTEARNINNKYVLAYHINTVYDISGGNEQYEYDKLEEKLSEAEYQKLKTKLQEKIIENNGSAYQTQAFKDYIEESDLMIYDPLFEYKFYSSYVDEYDLIEKDDFNSDYIFSIGDYKYSVEDFYNLVSVENGSDIITEQFQYDYVYQFYGDYVEDDTVESNKSKLSTAISDFNKGSNATYPKEIGQETFLLNSYGYATEEDVLKYYYTSAAALTGYKAKFIFDEWSKEVVDDETTSYELSDSAKNGYLSQILEKGNANYSEIFNLNVDHILINIDDDGDGSPDDPATFLDQKDSTTIAKFQNAVTELAKAIYTEASYSAYSDNSLFETLSFIVKEYNKGSSLLSMPEKTWDDYKEFNFLLKAEQLASSGDITQDSASQFVKPFADYIKEVYSIASSNNITVDKEYGEFIVTSNGTFEGGIPTSANDITFDNLCATSFGYHLLVINSYSGPSSLKFTKENNDATGEQNAVQVLISKGEDEDSDDDNIYVTLSSYNDKTNAANLNQLFIYYVQSKMGATSTLDTSIATLLGKLFTEAIGVYESSDFQTLLLLDKLQITSTDATLSAIVAAKRTSLANSVTEYDSTSDFIDWVSTSSSINWSRPDGK